MAVKLLYSDSVATYRSERYGARLSSCPVGVTLVNEYVKATGIQPNIPVFKMAMGVSPMEEGEVPEKDIYPEHRLDYFKKCLDTHVLDEVTFFTGLDIGAGDLVGKYSMHVEYSKRDDTIYVYSTPFNLTE